MQKDWRTDNWAGHYPVQTDPRNYHFARHLREFEPYATYNFDGPMSLEENDHPVRLVLIALVVLTILANLNIIIEVLTHIDSYYTMWVEGYNQMVLDLLN